MTVTWERFQSVVQLSIALNAAFAAFGAYSGGNIERQQERIQHIKDAVEAGAAMPKPKDDEVGGLGSLYLLEGKCDEIKADYLAFIHGIYRIICLAMAAIGVPFLFALTVYGEDTMYISFIMVLSSILYIPFIYGLLQVFLYSLKTYNEVTRPVDQIQSFVRKSMAG